MHASSLSKSAAFASSAPPTSSRGRSLFKSALSAGVFCAGMCVSLGAQSAILFEDDFSRSNSSTVGNGWFELQKDANDVGISSGQLRLRDHVGSAVDAAAWHTVDATGYEDLTLGFDWRATSSTEPSDQLFAGWRDTGGTFNAFWSTPLGGSPFSSVHVDLTSTFADSVFDLAFWIDVGASNETVYLDNVSLGGTLMTIAPPVVVAPPTPGPTPPTSPTAPTTPVASVDEPAGLAFIGLSMLMLARRKTGRAA